MKTFLNCDAFLYYFNNKTLEYKKDWNDDCIKQDTIDYVQKINQKYSEEEIKKEFFKVFNILQEYSPVTIIFVDEIKRIQSDNEKYDTRKWRGYFIGGDSWYDEYSSFKVYGRKSLTDGKIDAFPIIIEQMEEYLMPDTYEYCYLTHVKIENDGDIRLLYCVDELDAFRSHKELPERDFEKIYNELFTITE